jgi:hypothetical protein
MRNDMAKTSRDYLTRLELEKEMKIMAMKIRNETGIGVVTCYKAVKEAGIRDYKRAVAIARELDRPRYIK